jgi:hypothetical protein
MNLSLSELIVILGVLVCLSIITVLPYLLGRRIRAIKSRKEKLEAKQDATSGHSGETL